MGSKSELPVAAPRTCGITVSDILSGLRTDVNGCVGEWLPAPFVSLFVSNMTFFALNVTWLTVGRPLRCHLAKDLQPANAQVLGEGPS